MNNQSSTVSLVLKNGDRLHLEVIKVIVAKDWYNANELMLSESCKDFLIEVKHSKQTTLMNLSDVTPYILLHFDANGLFLSASFSINESKGSFILQTQSRYILFVRFIIDIPLKEINNIIL